MKCPIGNFAWGANTMMKTIYSRLITINYINIIVVYFTHAINDKKHCINVCTHTLVDFERHAQIQGLVDFECNFLYLFSIHTGKLSLFLFFSLFTVNRDISINSILGIRKYNFLCYFFTILRCFNFCTHLNMRNAREIGLCKLNINCTIVQLMLNLHSF